MTVELEDLKAMWLDLRAHVDELSDERQHYIDFFEKSPHAYVITDAHGTIVEANGAAVDVLQRRRRLLHGKPLAALVALERRADFRARLRRLTAGDTGAPRSWSTVFEAPELRTEATVTVRLIERPQAAGAAAPGGICWRLDAVQ